MERLTEACQRLESRQPSAGAVYTRNWQKGRFLWGFRAPRNPVKQAGGSGHLQPSVSGDEIDPGTGPSSVYMVGPESHVGDGSPVRGRTVEVELEIAVESGNSSGGEDLHIPQELEIVSGGSDQVVPTGRADQEVKAVSAPGVQLGSHSYTLPASHGGL